MLPMIPIYRNLNRNKNNIILNEKYINKLLETKIFWWKNNKNLYKKKIEEVSEKKNENPIKIIKVSIKIMKVRQMKSSIKIMKIPIKIMKSSIKIIKVSIKIMKVSTKITKVSIKIMKSLVKIMKVSAKIMKSSVKWMKFSVKWMKFSVKLMNVSVNLPRRVKVSAISSSLTSASDRDKFKLSCKIFFAPFKSSNK